MKLKPLGDRVVVTVLEDDTTTNSGIVITVPDKKDTIKAKVIAVGPGTSDVKMEVKVGDVVVYQNYSGTKVEYDNDEYMIISQGEILAIVE
ncbi:MAG: co-chaperone GroES [Lachnospirales bacterium]